MSERINEKPIVAHYMSKYLSMTEAWLYNLLINHQRFTPIVLTRQKSNASFYPFQSLYSLDDFTKLRQYCEILFFVVSGYFHFQRKICSTTKVQILHVHFGYNAVKLVGLKHQLNIKMLCSFYGDDAYAHPTIGNTAKKYAAMFKEVDRVLVLGSAMKSELIRLGCPEKKIFIHHLGIDIEKIEFKKRTIHPGSKIKFLVASGFVKKKGIDITIQALSRLKTEIDFSLDIIGDGPLKNEIHQAVENSGIQDRITLHGFKSYEYFLNIAHRSHVFIQASRTSEDNNKEGTPMAIVDAMATGLAVISTKHSDIPEIVRDGFNGFLAEENDIDSLEQCIRKLLANLDQVESFGINGRKWIEEEFNAKTQADKLEQHYIDLIRQN